MSVTDLIAALGLPERDGRLPRGVVDHTIDENVLLVLDDLQLATAEVRRWVREVGYAVADESARRGVCMLLVAAVRGHPPDAALGLVMELRDEPNLLLLPMGPFDGLDAAEFATERFGVTPSAEVVRLLFDRSGGVPRAMGVVASMFSSVAGGEELTVGRYPEYDAGDGQSRNSCAGEAGDFGASAWCRRHPRYGAAASGGDPLRGASAGLGAS